LFYERARVNKWRTAKELLKATGHILLSLFVGLAGLMGAFLAVVQVQVSIHGDQAFEHDAGANFALTMIGLGFAVPVGILCFVFVLHRLQCGRWLPRISD
jgi:hypothetical protein